MRGIAGVQSDPQNIGRSQRQPTGSIRQSPFTDVPQRGVTRDHSKHPAQMKSRHAGNVGNLIQSDLA